MKKSVVRIAAFLIIVAIVLSSINHIFRMKYADGIAQWDTFYKLDNNTVDVLILGSSHAFVNFNNGTLWNEYGISSFILGGSVQPMWNSYYFCKEALKTQKPELIVLEGFALTQDREYSDDSRIIKNTYGLKWSPDKVNAIIDSTPIERRREFLLTYSQYHTRYTGLNRGDFLWNENIQVDTDGRTHYIDWKGQYLFNISNPQVTPDVTNVSDKTDINGREEEYYRKIIELAQDNNIPIIVTVVPYVLDEVSEQRYNRAAEIADEYGVEFLDCNLCLQETGLNFGTDYTDTAHMNCDGSRKFSSFFGKHIKENYVISDRRGDGKYDSWQRNADYTEQYCKDYYLIQDTNINTLVQKVVSDEYILLVSVDGSCDTGDNNLKELFETLGIETDTSGIWYRTKEGIIWESGEGDNSKAVRCSVHDFGMKRSDRKNSILVDGNEKIDEASGVNIIVYDRILDTVIDCISIDNEDYSVEHNEEMNTF